MKHLRLSTNDIRAISGLSGMDSLEILSLGRNGLKNVAGLDPVCETLEQLCARRFDPVIPARARRDAAPLHDPPPRSWVSYNKITTFSGIERCQHLTTLYASNNMISKWAGVTAQSIAYAYHHEWCWS